MVSSGNTRNLPFRFSNIADSRRPMATVYGPPLNTHCTALEGPATVRISSSRGN